MMSPLPTSIVIYVNAISGGAGKNAVKYADILARGGYRVTLACGHAPSLDQFQPDAAVHIKVFGTRSKLLAIPHLRRVLALEAPQICLVVDASNMPAMLLALSACPIRPKLVLREALSTWQRLQMRGPVMRRIKWLIHTAGYRRCDKVIALTRDMKRELTTHWGLPEDRIALIPNGVDVAPMRASGTVRQDNLIVCVSRLEQQKDIATLLRAFAIVRKSVACRLAVAGTGRLQGALESLADTLKIARDVQFLGHVDDTATLYASARLVVLSSLWEGFPNVVIEALAQGTPVVSTRTPGAVEILENTKAGLLCDLGDAEDMAEKIMLALSLDWDETEILNCAALYSDSELTNNVLQCIKYI